MGYLNSQVVEIDAILTKKGRQILSQNPGDFVITKFALADDEVDYRLWNSNHSLGSDYYGEVIENMPILEATPNENQTMKFKLITLDKQSVAVPTITLPAVYVELIGNGRQPEPHYIIPTTVNVENGNSTSGYTATLSDASIATLFVAPGFEVPGLTTVNSTDVTTKTIFDRDRTTRDRTTREDRTNVDDGTVTLIGFRFGLMPKYTYEDKYGTVTVVGNETGGRVVLNFRVIGINNLGTN